jgi:hypothetical protein
MGREHVCSRTRRKDWLLQNKHLWEKGLVGRDEELDFIRRMIKEGLFSPSHLYNVKIERILEVAHNLECRYPGCKDRVHRLGLCNKHRKWVERGHMTEDLVVIKKPFERGIYQNPDAKCKIPNCEEKPRRNWMCSRHASQVKLGNIDLQGNPIAKSGGKISGKYPPDYPCKVCKRATGRISLGFCALHYNQYIKGKRDLDGISKMRQCKAIDCNRRLVRKDQDWCYRHRHSVERGIYNSFGKRLKPAIVKNEGKICSIAGCGKPAHCKGICRLHYSRQQFGYKGPAAYKNVGKPCTMPGCGKPASCRRLCPVHYLESRIHIDEKVAMLRDGGYSFKELAGWTVNKDGLCVGTNFAEYKDAVSWAYARFRQTTKFPLELFIGMGGYRSAKAIKKAEALGEKKRLEKEAKEQRRAARVAEKAALTANHGFLLITYSVN